MKKIVLFLLTFVSIFTLSACSNGEAGIFSNEKTTLELGTKLDAKSLVTVKDEKGKVVTEGLDDILVIDLEGVTLTEDGFLSELGEFYILYNVEFSKEYSLLLTINVVEAVNNTGWRSNGINVYSYADATAFRYGIPTSTWWDAHAIYDVENHDVNLNTVKAVVNGPENHEFVLKVESSTGVNQEVTFTTTGNDQTVLINLEPKFSSASLAGIQKVVLFNSKASEEGELLMYSFEFINQDAPTFTPEWSFYGGAYKEGNKIVFPKVAVYYNIGAIYTQTGYVNTEAFRLSLNIPEGHSYMVKFELSNAAHEATVVGTGETTNYDIIPPFTEDQFRDMTKLTIFWLDNDKDETSTFELVSIKGITLDEVVFEGELEVGFLNAAELSVQLRGNKVNINTVENVTFEGSVEGFDSFIINNKFWHGDGFIQSFIAFGGAVNGTVNVEINVLYNDEIVLTFKEEISYNTPGTDGDGDTTLPSIPDDFVIPDDMTGGTLNMVQPVEVYGSQHLKFAIEIPGLTKAEAEKLAVGFFSEDYPDAEIRVIGQVGDTGIHLEVNLMKAFPEGYGNADFDKFDFKVVFFNAAGEVVGFYSNK